MAETKRGFVLAFVIYLGALWWLWDTSVVYPLKIFVVFLHEISHGVAAILTGGAIDRITLSPDQGGVCYCGGGNRFLELSAGYLGSLAWGVLLLFVANRRPRWHRLALAVLGVAVVAMAGIYVRSGFGVLFGIAFGAGLIAAARFLPPAAHTVALTILGLTSCLYAILDIKSDILERPGIRSDARMLAEHTGVPTLVWGAAWIAVAVAVSWWLVRRRWRRAV